MARRNELILIRNKNVKLRYRELEIKNPHWKHGAIIEELIKEFYISKCTITAILNNERGYATAV